MTTIYDLPKPGSPLSARSKLLSDHIRQIISEQNKAISFADFMELALYHPEFGYYNADTFDLGEHGDFTTAPEISPLFAKCIARQIQQIHHALGKNNILELGAGTGQLAHDLLSELNRLGCLPDYYYICEISKTLQKKQQDFLRSACPDFYSRIIWLDHLPEHFIGTIVANEVLDALPAHCLCIQENQVKERCVNWDGEKFIWELCPPGSTELTKSALALQELYELPDGYQFEINLAMRRLIESLSHSLEKGIMLLVDYGYGQEEYYHPERRQGTLTCFYQHQRHDDPLILPGLQDITTHVDFTSVIDKAADCGFSLSGYTSQTAFLLACGLSELVSEEEKHLSQADEVKLHHAVKLLTLPTEMGERIKFMALSKQMDLALLGFNLQDRRRDL